MKKQYLVILLFAVIIGLYSFIILSDNWTDLPAVIKLKYNPKDSSAIGQIDNLVIQNDSNCIRFFGKILNPTKNNDLYTIFVDSIGVLGKSFYQKLDLEEGISLIRIYRNKDIWQSEYSIKILDLNKDNYPDIAIYNDVMSGNANHTFSYYLYYPNLKRFKINYNFSLPNLVWNENNKTYSSFASGGQAGLIYSQNTYKVKNDSLIIIEIVSQDYNQKLDKYIRITKTLEKTVIDTLTIKN
jgi:hypothetical protein